MVRLFPICHLNDGILLGYHKRRSQISCFDILNFLVFTSGSVKGGSLNKIHQCLSLIPLFFLPLMKKRDGKKRGMGDRRQKIFLRTHHRGESLKKNHQRPRPIPSFFSVPLFFISGKEKKRREGPLTLVNQFKDSVVRVGVELHPHGTAPIF